MSWSVVAVGKAPAVAASLEKSFASISCAEPEQTIKNAVAQVVATALSAYNPNMPVRVEASGSQSHDDWNKPEAEKTGTKANYLSVNIEPIWNFAE
ncbi:MAG TPA: hypothetical protein VN682_05105 [Terriglobales bacterium]|nr:hypothetical protein [Terriglobales bacterium]